MITSRQSLTFVALCAVSVAISWRALFATFSLALGNGEYTHILLILPVSVALVFLRLDVLLATPRPNIRVGGCLLLLALFTSMWGKWAYAATYPDVALSLSMLALVMWWIGTVIFCFGTRGFRSDLFPLLFLLWLVPLPAFMLDRIVILLQQGSAVMTHFLFSAAGVPVSLNGVVLSIPGVDIEVAQECSSIRSSLMLMVASMVLAHLFLRSPWRQAAVVITAIPLSVAKNAVRIFTLSMLATHVDPSFLTGKLHHQGGIVFFLLALGIVWLMIWLLQRAEAESGAAHIRLPVADNPAAHR